MDLPECQQEDAPEVFTEPELRVLTVNLAHGRKDGFNQSFQSGDTARRNIAEAAEHLERLDADVIALQEADAPSRWSGNFDHVQAVADAAGYGCQFHGVHAQGAFYNFGTALLSRYRFHRAAQHDFEPTPPTTRKGFVAAQLPWNPAGVLDEPVMLTLVSLHLDFSRRSTREAQFAAMTRVLEQFPRPLVVMGDFNTEWESRGGLLKTFADNLDLHAWAPAEAGYGTYEGGKKRLDWVLVSREIGFADYAVIDTVVSDHLPVWAQLRLASTQPER
ncbi:MAG: endonuclease/exonuclease/phosphatase family protein [Xanthomonadales bacterium]|nr:endonuclease/exonuclease/phosphatase family protein [Xanthomonadales bacterium]